MFGFIEDAVKNTVDVSVGIMTLGEYGDVSTETVSKLIADGIEVATIASLMGVGEDVIYDLLSQEE